MKLRFYSFCQVYLSSIQQGIQTGHAAVDIVRKYTASGNPFNANVTLEKTVMVENWADCHKTFVTLNGGNHMSLNNILITVAQSPFPWVCFNEDQDSLNSMLTCVGVILPENVYDVRRDKTLSGLDAFIHDTPGSIYVTYDQYDPLFNLINTVKSARLAQ